MENKYRIRESSENNAAIEVMIESLDRQDDSFVGSFWYDPKSDELFGVYSVLADDVSFYKSKQWNCEVKTGSRLHSAIWKRESHRGRDKRFQGDYTKVPRGRVFEFKDRGYIVFTGNWIDDYPHAKSLILDEFQLPKDNTEFKKDIHWEIGHGWSEEF